MELLNEIDVETRSGGRTFELLYGDIVHLETPVDLLVVSVIGQSYYPLPESVIGALHQHLSIDVARLAEHPTLDFRDALNCWVVRSTREDKFRHLLCVEAHHAGDPKRAIKRLFTNVFATIAALEAKGYKLNTVLMPLLATGIARKRASFDVELVMKVMLEQSLNALEHSRTLHKIQFILRDEDQALQFSDAMDNLLGRRRASVPQGGPIQAVRRKITDRITTANLLAGSAGNQALDELGKAMSSSKSRPFALGVAARKTVEFIIHDMMAGKSYRDVNGALKQLEQQDQGPAMWIVYYMEVIRTLGNNAAHMNMKHQRQPANPTSADLELLLLCLLRVLDFWIERKRAELNQVPATDGDTSPSLVSDLAPPAT